MNQATPPPWSSSFRKNWVSWRTDSFSDSVSPFLKNATLHINLPNKTVNLWNPKYIIFGHQWRQSSTLSPFLFNHVWTCCVADSYAVHPLGLVINLILQRSLFSRSMSCNHNENHKGPSNHNTGPDDCGEDAHGACSE